MMPGMRFANLDDERMKKLQAVEELLGVYLLALEPDTYQLAQLDEAGLKALHEAEKDLGVILLAYQPKE
ncbi:MAG: hypothetical protein GYB65_12430 [Chloroflexi bacterium]|nr:hypothetical protein [Chloroflexota bacterium]